MHCNCGRNDQYKSHDFSHMSARAVPFDERFLEKSWEWLKDDELRHLIMAPLFTRDEQLAWYTRVVGSANYLIWGIECDREPIGVFGLKGSDGTSGEYWGYIGDKLYWGRGIGRWMVQEAILRAKNLGLRHVHLKVASHNVRAIKLYLSLEFSVCQDDGVLIQMERWI